MQSEKTIKHQEEVSETQDTSSLQFTTKNQTLFCNLLSSKIYCALGRTFLHRLKLNNSQQVKYKNNLAILLAKKMHIGIQNEVIKMVKYYEEHMQDQLHRIHQLVEQNHKLRSQVEKYEDKQNVPMQTNSLPCKNEHVEDLQKCVLQKNKQISALNREVTELIIKVKKYKKRVYELEAKSPVKSVSSQFV